MSNVFFRRIFYSHVSKNQRIIMFQMWYSLVVCLRLSFQWNVIQRVFFYFECFLCHSNERVLNLCALEKCFTLIFHFFFPECCNVFYVVNSLKFRTRPNENLSKMDAWFNVFSTWHIGIMAKKIKKTKSTNKMWDHNQASKMHLNGCDVSNWRVQHAREEGITRSGYITWDFA